MPQAPSHGPLTTNLRAPGAPRERQLPAAGLYSGAMMLPPPYRPATSPATGFGRIIFQQDDFRLLSGEALKKRNFVGILLNFAPVIASPFVPGGALSFPCQLPTAYYLLPPGYTCVAPPLPGLKTRARPQGEGVPQDLYTLIIWKNE